MTMTCKQLDASRRRFDGAIAAVCEDGAIGLRRTVQLYLGVGGPHRDHHVCQIIQQTPEVRIGQCVLVLTTVGADNDDARLAEAGEMSGYGAAGNAEPPRKLAWVTGSKSECQQYFCPHRVRQCGPEVCEHVPGDRGLHLANTTSSIVVFARL